MKFFACVCILFNLYIGGRFFLNVVHVLQTSKYSKTATIVFAVLFLSMGIAGVYVYMFKNNYRLALLIGIGPWAIALLLLLLNMMMGDYK